MDVNDKLLAHLVHIVAPLGVPLTGAQLTELCSKADRAQREAAVDRARIRVPLLLPDEEYEAADWIAEAPAEDTCHHGTPLAEGCDECHEEQEAEAAAGEGQDG